MKDITIALTQGDTNGIGLETVLKALNDEHITEIFTPVLFANHHLVKNTLKMIGAENLPVNFIRSAEGVKPGKINVVNVGRENITPAYGEETPAGGAAAVESLAAACNFIDDGGADALVTAPINKSAAQVEGFNFPGHTEFLQERFGEGEEARMILFDDNLRVMLQTTHLPVSEVASKIVADEIAESVRIFKDTLVSSFEIERPKIAVLALNPHSGDNGLLGHEEKDEIAPAIARCCEEGMLVFGPFAADGFFATEAWRKFDGVLAMYHDQGLAPFKAIARENGVNYTANLPVVRTSPDHGTAYDIAGKNMADATSMRRAIYEAIDIARARDRYEEISDNPLKISRDVKPDKRKDPE